MGAILVLLTNPKAATKGIILILNLILLGFGFWWNANALVLFALVVTGSMVAAYISDECLGMDPLFATVFWLVPPLCGAIGVTAYRCMRSCGSGDARTPFPTPGELSECHSCPSGIDVDQFAWTVDTPWYLGFLDWAVQWFVDLINFIPEGICWINMVVGTVFLIISLWPVAKDVFFGGTDSSAGGKGVAVAVVEGDNEAPERPLIALKAVDNDAKRRVAAAHP